MLTNSDRHTSPIAFNGTSQHLHDALVTIRPDDAVLEGVYRIPAKQISNRLFAEPHVVGVD